MTGSVRTVRGLWSGMTRLVRRHVDRRLQTGPGSFADMAVAYLNLAYFENFYEAVDLAEDGSILLDHRDGTVLARYPRVPGLIGTSYADQPPFATVLAHSQAGTVIMASPLDGQERILAIRALKSFPLPSACPSARRGCCRRGGTRCGSSSQQPSSAASAWSACCCFGLVGMLLHLSRKAQDADVTERLRTMQELARRALLDPLTGLLNRTGLSERLEQRLAQASAAGSTVSLLFIDLDGFKRINDARGHRAGDAVLVAIARRIQKAPSGSDVARWGGDEFVVISAAAPPHSFAARTLAHTLLREVSRPIDVDGQTVRVGGTVGIATFPQDGSTPDVLLSAADAAMYEGKQAGGSRVQTYDPALAGAAAAAAGLERDLRHALGAQALSVAYQPIIDMPGERCVAFEALLRWDHPVHGPVSPSVFIPVAEQCGLIGQLGQWVLTRACQDAATWPGQDDLMVTVNVSLAQVLSGELLDDVRGALERSGLPPHLLQLEMTESMVGNDHGRIVPVLQTVRALGVRIALDDFGTGFSSLSRLRNWPIDTVKIDKAFVRAMDRDGTAVIRATLLVAHEYGLHVTVEGVETVEQWRELAGVGVRSFQGYLFSHPLPATGVVPWTIRVSQPAVPHARGFGWAQLKHSPLIEQAADPPGLP